jgi:hypothetical protein
MLTLRSPGTRAQERSVGTGVTHRDVASNATGPSAPLVERTTTDLNQ